MQILSEPILNEGVTDIDPPATSYAGSEPL